ncbi:MAG: hypothetical protein JNK22_04720 [Rhodocyclaceae bacterium]|nr:hypothetical protein [Rhodocyclaceae bacterium]
MNPQMRAFFNTLKDGVAVVDGQGLVQFANAAGGRFASLAVGEPFPESRVLNGLADLVAGRARAPLLINLADGVAGTRSAVLSPLPIPGHYALTLNAGGEGEAFETAIRNLFDFIDSEVGAPIDRFARGLEESFEEDSVPDSLAALFEDAKAAAVLLKRTKMLAELFRTTTLIDRERLPLAEMVRDVLDAEGKLIGDRDIQVHLDGLDEELPPVYGSRAWLTRALREIVDNALRQAPPKSFVGLALQCTGAHVIVKVSNHGHFRPAALASLPVFVPFHRIAQYVKERKMPRKALTGRPAETPAGGPGLGLALCQRIVALHGGRLQLPEEDTDGLVEVRLELATGAPAVDDEALNIEQAKRYAQDMAALMHRMRAARGAAQRATGA